MAIDTEEGVQTMPTISPERACGACGRGRRTPGTTTLTVTRDTIVLVYLNVPAEVCDVCDEELLAEETARAIERLTDEAIAGGVRMQIREFKAA